MKGQPTTAAMATPTATLELDPIFVKALRLLHSKAKDSADQLKQMLDDVLHHRPISSGIGSSSSSGSRDYAKPSIPPTKLSIKQESGSKLILTTVKKSSPKHPTDVLPTSKKSSSSRDDDPKKAEKRTFDKVIKQEVIETPGPETKRTKLESPKPSPSPSPPPVLKIEIKKEVEDFSTDDWNTDADDFAMEMGLACMICRNIEVSSGNQLVECQECHNLYHQECHRPAITDQDVNDPRVVWYCAKCAKNIRKLTIKTQKTSKTIQPTIVKEPMVPTKVIKVEPPAPSHLFKRTEIKSTLAPSSSGSSSRSSSSSSGNKPIGLAGLAASLTGKSSSLSKSSSQLGNHGSKALSISKPSAVLPNLSKAATSSVGATPSPSVASQAAKSGGPFAALASSIKTPTPSGTSVGSGITSLSSKSSSSALPSSSSSKTTAASSSSGGNGNGNGSGKTASSSSLMSADKRLQIMKKKAEKKKQEKRWSSK